MGVWWHLRQWVYARPRVAAAGAVALLLLVGFGGWQSARWFASDGAAQAADTAVFGVKAARTVRIEDKNGRVIDHIVGRTRTLTLPGQGHTVVVIKGVTRVVPTVRIRNGGVIVETRPGIVKTVTNVYAQTVVKTHTVTQLLDHTVTVTQTQVQPAQTEAAGTQIPPGHARPTVTVTVTQTVTQAAVTVTVTTSKGH
jgi:hypothetical protein